ncbi:MAG: hypothetical protein CMH57_00605 [Myxococcales bacterium]|nr:hypothetical protein [Myxococcales bacterium]
MSSANTPHELTNPIRGLTEWVQANLEASSARPEEPLLHKGRFIEVYDPVLGLGLVGQRAADHLAVLISLDEADLLRAYSPDGPFEDEAIRDKLRALAEERDAQHLKHLLLCDWHGDPYGPTLYDSQITLELCRLAPRFTGLRSLYVGDALTRTGPPQSYVQGVGALLRSFPDLEELHVCSRVSLLGVLRHARLKTLRVETLEEAYEVMLDLSRSHLPSLERLDLWLTDMGGGGGFDEFADDIDQDELELFAPLLSGKATPALQHLALCNTWLSDPLVIELTASPLFGRLRHLDLSGGTLTDRGARALIAAAAHTRLETLTISRNFVSASAREHLRQAGAWTLRDSGQRLDDWVAPEFADVF